MYVCKIILTPYLLWFMKVSCAMCEDTLPIVFCGPHNTVLIEAVATALKEKW